MTSHMKTITKHISTDAGDVFISYQPCKQSSDGPTIVFLHGWGSDHRAWSQVVRSSKEATLSIDLPGFGSSQVPDQPLTVSDVADALMDIIDTCELSNVVLVGHSFGGQVAAAIAARQPGWLHGLVLVGAAVIREKNPPFLSRVGEKIGPVFRLPILSKLRPLMYKMIGADIPPEDPVMQQTMRNVLRDDQRNKLSEIKVPTQVIWGNNDQSTPLSEGEQIADKISRSDLVVLDGGHYIFLDQPTIFIDTIHSFIKRIS
jgi:pimeloyl-ACP methyl ester carboxylesterase